MRLLWRRTRLARKPPARTTRVMSVLRDARKSTREREGMFASEQQVSALDSCEALVRSANRVSVGKSTKQTRGDRLVGFGTCGLLIRKLFDSGVANSCYVLWR